MKRFILAVFVLLLAFVTSVSAQAPAQAKTLIPRRVLVLPPSESGLENLGAEQKELLKNFPYFLFSEITSLKPVILTLRQEEANSVIRTTFAAKEEGAEILCSLSEKETVKLEERFDFLGGKTSFADYSAKVRGLAGKLVPFLQDVEPEYSVERRQQEERKNRIVKEATFEDSLDKPFAVTLWTGGFLQFITGKDFVNEPYDSEIHIPHPLHFLLDFAWYPSTNFGLVASLWLDRNTDMSFGSSDMLVSSREKSVLRYSETENLFILGGLGFGYRTLGRVAGEFNLLYYAGLVRVTAKEDIFYLYRGSSGNGDFDKVLVLAEGQNKLFFINFLSMQPAFAFALTERLSLKTRLTVNFDPSIILKHHLDNYPYSRSSNWLFSYLGEVGISIRF